jgi:hypothetical protein
MAMFALNSMLMVARPSCCAVLKALSLETIFSDRPDNCTHMPIA